MKINTNILIQSIWDVVKYPLLGVGAAGGTFGLISLLFYFIGPWAFPATILLMMFGLLIMFICVRYQDLMREHNKKQKDLVDILKR